MTWIAWATSPPSESAAMIQYMSKYVGGLYNGTSLTGRESFAMSKNGFLPPWFAVVHNGSGIPRRALVINFVLGVAFLLPFGSWQQIVAATSVLGLIAYALPSVSAVVFDRGDAYPGGAPRWIRWLAPVAFVLASLIIYWAGWKELRIALPILLVGAGVYAYQHWRAGAPWEDARLGLWLVSYLALVLLMSGIGSADFQGVNAVPAPWDSVVVAVIALAAWLAGVRAGQRYLAEHPAPDAAPHHAGSAGSAGPAGAVLRPE